MLVELESCMSCSTCLLIALTILQCRLLFIEQVRWNKLDDDDDDVTVNLTNRCEFLENLVECVRRAA